MIKWRRCSDVENLAMVTMTGGAGDVGRNMGNNNVIQVGVEDGGADDGLVRGGAGDVDDVRCEWLVPHQIRCLPKQAFVYLPPHDNVAAASDLSSIEVGNLEFVPSVT